MLNFREFIKEKFLYRQLICILIFVFYVLGLFAFYCLDFKIVFLSVSAFALFFLFLLMFKKIRGLYNPLFVAVLYLFFMAGFLIAKVNFVNFDSFSNIDYLKNVELKGYVDNIPKFSTDSNSYKFPFKVTSIDVDGINYPVYDALVLANVIKLNDEKISAGDYVKLKGILTLPSSAKNPGEFDYRNFLKRKGILKTFYVNNVPFEILKSPSVEDIFKADGFKKIYFLKNFLVRKMSDVRENAIFKHSKYIKSPELEVLGGIVFGDDAVNPPDDIKENFINSGLLHLLAASGLNVALILSMWFFVIYFLNIPYKIKIVSGLCVIFIYSLMTGFPPSIIRACVMLALILIGKLMYREADGVSLIFCAGILILIFKPVYAVDVGFQLSFLVTLGLIVCTPCVNSLLKPYDKKYLKAIKNYPKIIKTFLLLFMPVSLACIFFIPLIAQMWAAPLQAYYFNTFSPYSISANVAVVPFIGIISFLGFISTAICFVPYLSDLILPFLDFILNYLIKILLFISNYFAGLDYSIIKVKSPNVLFILSFYIFSIFLFYSFKNLFKKKILNCFTVLFFLLSSLLLIDFPKKGAEVIFFAVNNADNFLIKTNDNKYIMIDTGRFVYRGKTSAKTVTLEYFYDSGIKTLDTLIVTHYDSDHSGGLLDILDEIKVNNLIIPKLECNTFSTCKIKEYIDKNNIKYEIPYNFQTFEYDGVKITNFVPAINSKSRNDSSTVTLADIYGYKFLFLADISKDALESLIKYLPDNIFLLKAAHHGADGTINEKLIGYLNPEFSVLSVGKNPYGHPSIKTVDILDKHSHVLSTDDLGAIKFVVSKDKISLMHFDGVRKKFLPVKLAD